MAKRHLLLVEDNPQHLRVMEVSLRKAGFAVTTAANGAQARSKLTGSPPDLIISDTEMPGQDGFDLCRWVRENPALQDTPFIFVTDDASAESRVHGLELGADDYLTRPIYSRELTTRVEMALERRERQRLKQGPEQRRFYGELEQMSVTDLLQAMEMGKKSGRLVIQGDGIIGQMVFTGGRVIDANTGEIRGEEAVYRILGWDRGAFEIHFGAQDGPGTIDQTTEALLMEGMRRLDQWARVSEQLPPLDEVYRVDYDEYAANLADLPDEATSLIRLFEGGNTIERCIQQAPVADVDALSAISQLVFSGVIYRASDRPESVEQRRSASAAPPSAPPQSIADALLESASQLPAVKPTRPGPNAARPRRSARRTPPRSTREEPQIRVVEDERPMSSEPPPTPMDREDPPTLPLEPMPAERVKHVTDAPISPFDEDLAPVAEEALFPSLGDAFEDEVDDFFGPGAEDIGLSTDEEEPRPFDDLVDFEEDEDEVSSGRAFQLAMGLLLFIVAGGVSFIFLQDDIEPRKIKADSLHTGWHEQELAKRPRVTQVPAFDAGWRIPSEPDGGVSLPVGEAPTEVDAGAVAATGEAAKGELKPPAKPPAKPAEVDAPEASPAMKKDSRTLTSEGIKLHNKGKYGQAVKRFERALELTPTAKTTLVAYTKSLLEVNRLRDALAAAEKAAQVDPKNAEVFLLLGNARQDLKSNAGAIKAYERYLELSPKGKFATEVKQVIKGLKAAATN